MARRRHLSRIAVMQALFEQGNRPAIDVLDSLQRNERELVQHGDVDEEFALQLLTGILDKLDVLRDAVQTHAPGWTLDRMDPVSRALLLIGAYELLYHRDAPPAVVMNEAIDIAKEYATDEAGKFVNGVLNAIAQNRT